MSEENEAVIDKIKTVFRPHSEISKDAWHEDKYLFYRGNWGSVYWLREALMYECFFNLAGVGHKQIAIDVNDEPHLVISAVGAYTAPRLGNSYNPDLYKEATIEDIKRIVDKAFLHLAEDIARRSLGNFAEDLVSGDGYKLLQRIIAWLHVSKTSEKASDDEQRCEARYYMDAFGNDNNRCTKPLGHAGSHITPGDLEWTE